ncbi:extensin family protein [Azospirillum doebereinerae]|uniref:extensin-like domain-containing protein n=1 Tax=Azospirillum doebereinerae TaxID=92933 RepID=UPI001EE5E812|nr:extensin family protein [Azospirillum doebereinerae]MCG5238482.1 extensin family protein [Azospirillum doebereinerae]
MARFFLWTLLLLLIAVSAAVVLVRGGIVTVPDRYDPWAPLDLQAAPNLLTRLKLARLDGDPGQCLAVLGGSRLRFIPAPDRESPAGCALLNTVRVTRSELGFSSGFTATCTLAAAWMLFETHALQPAAERHFGQRIARIRHLGTFACRNVYGRTEGRRSEHATANAIDVAEFTLEDGTAISLTRDWGREGSKPAAFLREVRDGACRFFAVVLGPDYNRAHHDHFHLDMGGFRTCR